MKVAICVPCFDVVRTKFTSSLVDMVAFTMGATITYNGVITKPQIKTIFEMSGPLDWKRTQLVKWARQWPADYLLWIDSDQTFPPDALLRLVKHDLAVVGCNYPTREDEPRPTAFDLSGNPLRTTEAMADVGKVEPVGALGLGFCLMKIPVFDLIEERLPDTRLFTTAIKDGELVAGEDVYFFNVVLKAGITAHVDHALSWSIGHLAETVKHNSDVREGANADTVLPSAGAQ